VSGVVLRRRRRTVGMMYRVYVGPFAEWRILPGFNKARGAQLAELVDWIQDHDPCLDFGDTKPTVVIGRKRYTRSCWVAYYYRKTRRRQFEWPGLRRKDRLNILEFSSVDVGGEIAWFRSTFDEQLRRLAGYYGQEPSLKWGVVPLSD
jgi:hypothetical protein